MKDGWQTKKLGDLCAIELGRTPSRANKAFWDERRRTGNVWLSIADLLVTDDSIVVDSREYLSDEGAAICKTVCEGTLLASFKLTLGRLAFAGRDLFTNEAIAALTILDERHLSKEYLFYFLHFFDWDQVTEGDIKLKGKTLNKSKLREIGIHFPAPSEHRRIVDNLKVASAAIATARESTERNLRNARAVFESHVDSVFSNPGDEWVKAPLSELCDIKHGLAFKSEFSTDTGGAVLLTPGNFFETGGYRDRGNKQKYYCGELPPGFVLSAGDLLVAMTEQAAGLLGSPILVPSEGTYLHNQRLGLVTGRPGVPWSNEFFFRVFNTPAVRKELHDSASGTKVRHTSPTKIGAVVVAYPTSLEEQARVVAELNAVASETASLEANQRLKLAALDALKQSLLHEAFAGKL